jgi:hypothetical protein
MAALFSFGSTFDATVQIDGLPMPIHVTRLDRPTLAAFDAELQRLAPPEAELETWDRETEAERRAFLDRSITEYVTLDAGILHEDGRAITAGADVARIFQRREDVLQALVTAIWRANHLIDLFSPQRNAHGR